LIILFIILLVAYNRRKTRREVRRAELESQAAIQSLQTTLDEHKRTLQDEVEAHQMQQNSTANEVRDFVKENPEITAALIRSMIRND
jgi:flagellar biosynthesis/type III secretory pathway M-ring protein FliF/YscJ